MSRLGTALLLLLALFLWRNTDTYLYEKDLRAIHALTPATAPSSHFAALDEYQLLQGYRQSPDLLHQSLHWWQGSWIHPGTRYFRPLSSYLHWFHCWGWNHWGEGWFLWLGIGLYAPALVILALLARRFVSSHWLVLVGAGLLVLGGDINGWPSHWLAWFPGQPHFLLATFMTGSLLCFDLWLERGKLSLLVGTGLCLIVACLIKEHAYVLPFQLAALALLRPGASTAKARGRALALFFITVCLLYFYRKWALPNADEPHFRPVRLLRGALTHTHWELRLPLQDEIYDIPLSALGLFGLFFLVRWLRQQPRIKTWQEHALGRIGLVLTLLLGVGLCLLPGSLGVALLDPNQQPKLLLTYLGLLFVYCQLYLTFKYARRYSSLCAWLLVVLSNYPVGAAFGWHYDIIGWQFQLPYVAVLLELTWQEVVWPRILARRPA